MAPIDHPPLERSTPLRPGTLPRLTSIAGAASPTIVNAVVNALRPLGVTYIDMPLTPMRVWQAIQNAQGGQS